jgi:hypothetical protein
MYYTKAKNEKSSSRNYKEIIYKKTLLALSMPYLLSAYTIPELFEALKNH